MSEEKAGSAGEEQKGQEAASVPIEEFNQLKAQFEEGSQRLGKLESENKKLKDELLSPEYIQKLNTQMKKSEEALSEEPDKTSKEAKELRTLIAGLHEEISVMKAREELGNTRNRYKDFDEYKSGILDRCRRNPTMSYEDAYLAEKAYQNEEKTREDQEKAARAASEKPGGINYDSTSPREFKNADEANEDAWTRVVGNKETL